MTKEALLEKIKKETPRLVYLSGKTSTGKSTFANDLRDVYGYSKIELDDIVFSAVVKPFNIEIPTNAFRVVYRDTEPKEQVEAFIEASKKEIAETLKHSPVVVEGAIAKSRVLKEIFSGEMQDFLFVYFNPVNIDAYIERIQKRLMKGWINNAAGLPKEFWDLVDQNSLEAFEETRELSPEINKSIADYVLIAMKQSEERLIHFKESFPDITTLEI